VPACRLTVLAVSDHALAVVLRRASAGSRWSRAREAGPRSRRLRPAQRLCQLTLRWRRDRASGCSTWPASLLRAAGCCRRRRGAATCCPRPAASGLAPAPR